MSETSLATTPPEIWSTCYDEARAQDVVVHATMRPPGYTEGYATVSEPCGQSYIACWSNLVNRRPPQAETKVESARLDTPSALFHNVTLPPSLRVKQPLSTDPGPADPELLSRLDKLIDLVERLLKTQEIIRVR